MILNQTQALQLPPLSLYVHIPWCVEKCPYCDFNSHTLKTELPHEAYVDHLLADLTADLHYVQGREIKTIFIGGGTPSLLSEKAMATLLEGIRRRVKVADDAEITMEANPNSVEATRFASYQASGINRISIGVQSFNSDKLNRLGRIHNPEEAIRAANIAKSLNLRSFNLDVMHGLPNQTFDEAMADLDQVIQINPPHFSWYQLTIEANTGFASKPPTLPQEDTLWDIYEQGHQRLIAAGYIQYETSAYAKPDLMCEHNLNYWRFGDYLGIGCGAHGKITLSNGTIIRSQKTKHPKGYMQPNYLDKSWQVEKEDIPFEYFMNRFRLFEATPIREFELLTGMQIELIQPPIQIAIDKGYITATQSTWQITERGKLFLNDLLSLFLTQ